MAFSKTISGRTVFGNMRVVWGTYTNTDTDSGGAIDTGLDAIFGFSTVPTGHVSITPPKYSASAGVVTLVCQNGDDGKWFAFGL